MKPTIQISSDKRISERESFGTRSSHTFPQTDYGFQTTADLRGSPHSFDGEAVAAARGFRKLSREYFHVETRSFLAELTAFGAIIVVSAWPIVTMIRTVGHLLK